MILTVIKFQLFFLSTFKILPSYLLTIAVDDKYAVSVAEIPL